MTTSVNPARGGKANFPYILAQSAVPVCLAPNGTIATNGTVTLGTALPTTYSGGIWLRFPANAVSGDSTGGLYWAVMSSTTVGIVYAGNVDPATEFVPYIGSTGGGAVTGSNSAYTQTTAADVTLVNVTVPGGTMGANGAVRTVARWSLTNNANSKSVKLNFGGTSTLSNTPTSAAGFGSIYTIRNRGVANKQFAPSYTSDTTSGTPLFPAIDTSVDVALTFPVQMATATDYVVLEGFSIELMPS